MSDVFNLLLSQNFLARALIVGVLVSLCCALLGVSLVLKRFSMIGDGLSHVGFGAMAIAAAAGLAPLSIAVPTVMLAAFFLLKINNRSLLGGDSAIAMISTVSLALCPTAKQRALQGISPLLVIATISPSRPYLIFSSLVL
jgi:zinc transport system permease protein